MQRAVALVAASAALSWVQVGASPHARGAISRRCKVPKIPGYSFSGCYTEATDSRALTGPAYFDDHMTVEKCAAVCSGFQYFGVEYGSECYCGNTLEDGSVQTQLAECNLPCSGDSTENCGAGDRLDLFTRTTGPAPASPIPSAYTSEGCYTEATGTRALSDVSYYDDDMTVEKCAAVCADYTWFGVEYGRECYGGNTINSAQGSVPTSLSECSFPCAGNSSEACGAGDRLNMYRNTGSATTTSSSATVTGASSTSTDSGTSSAASTTASDESSTSSAEPSTSTVEPSVTSSSEPSTSASQTSTSASETSTVASETSTSASETSTSASETSTSASETSTSASETSTSSPDASTSTSTSSADATTSSADATTSSADATTSSADATTSSADATTPASTSSAAASTTSSAPSTGITNGGFESSGGWTTRTSAPGVLTYNFANTNAPHSGLYSASVTYTAGASAYQAWFNQPITLNANTQYNFAGWAKASSANPGCSISYYIGTVDGNQNLKTLATITSANLRPTWTQSTGFYLAGTATELSFNVRWTCTGASSRVYYIDDLSLVEA